MATDKHPELKVQPRPYFLEFLRARLEAEGGYAGLEKAITNAYKANMVDPRSYKRPHAIDRRKLKRLLNCDRSVSLSIMDLEALHSYLELFGGGGLTRRPFFVHSSIVQELVEKPNVTLVLGSRMSSEGPDLSHWDWQASEQIQRTINRYATHMRFDVIEVRRDTEKAGSAAAEWKNLFDVHGPSVICIGSPRANRASERVLKTLLNPKNRTPAKWDSLPFYFVFLGGEETGGASSAFSRPLESFDGSHAKLVDDVRQGKGWGLIAGKESFLSEAATKPRGGDGTRILQKSIRSYGVIAAQRQAQGQVWVVVAGLTGPGTLAAASCLGSMTGTLPQPEDPHSNAVLWGVVETIVETKRMIDAGTPPDLRSLRFVVGPSLWDPKKRCEIVS